MHNTVVPFTVASRLKQLVPVHVFGPLQSEDGL